MFLNLLILLRRIQNKIYSHIIKSNVAVKGKGFHVEYPCRIIGGEHITIGQNFNSFSRLRIEAHDAFNDDRFEPVIQIGDNVLMNFDCHIGCINKIVIGNNVLFASKIFITDHFHGNIDTTALNKSPISRSLYSKGPVIIKDNVWVGEGVVIMPDVTIGENCIIGANSVVTKSFPANSVLAGNPAKLIRLLV